MRAGLTISTVAHGAFLIWSVLTLVAKPFDSKPMESMPVDVVTADEFSKITKGEKDAKKVELPKPRAEKVAEAKPVEETVKKVTDKKEISATQAAAEPPPPAETKPDKAEKKPEKVPEPKTDPIAEALKKDEAKKPPEKPEIKMPPKKPVQQTPKFDPAKVAALLDKRDPQRQVATGAELNSLSSLGASTGTAAQLSQSELDAFRARLRDRWSVPAGIRNPEQFAVLIRVRFKRDGTLAGPPMVLTSGKGTTFEAVRDAAVRALLLGQPFNMLRPDHYETWQEIDVTFDPKEMFPG